MSQLMELPHIKINFFQSHQSSLVDFISPYMVAQPFINLIFQPFEIPMKTRSDQSDREGIIQSSLFEGGLEEVSGFCQFSS